MHITKEKCDLRRSFPPIIYLKLIEICDLNCKKITLGRRNPMLGAAQDHVSTTSTDIYFFELVENLALMKHRDHKRLDKLKGGMAKKLESWRFSLRKNSTPYQAGLMVGV
jgi:hypothetical protein